MIGGKLLVAIDTKGTWWTYYGIETSEQAGRASRLVRKDPSRWRISPAEVGPEPGRDLDWNFDGRSA